MKTTRRKIIQHGPSSLTVSIPSKWAKKYNIKKGDEIDITENNELIMIEPANQHNSIKKTEISFINLDDSMQKKILIALYQKGYDEIKIYYKTQDIQKKIYTSLNNLNLGFEIIEQDSDFIIIKNISSPQNSEFNNLFRRAFRITIEYAKKTETIIKNSEDITESCLLYKLSQNRISNFCKRIIIKENKEKSSFIYTIIENLEIITQNITTILNRIKNTEIDMNQTLINEYTDLTDLLMQTHNLFYKYSINDYNKIKVKLTKIKYKTKTYATNEQISQNNYCYCESNQNICKKIDKILDLILLINL